MSKAKFAGTKNMFKTVTILIVATALIISAAYLFICSNDYSARSAYGFIPSSMSSDIQTPDSDDLDLGDNNDDADGTYNPPAKDKSKENTAFYPNDPSDDTSNDDVLEEGCFGDLNGNDFVGFDDIDIIKAHYGLDSEDPLFNWLDLDDNGVIGGGDVNIIKANYGPCS